MTRLKLFLAVLALAVYSVAYAQDLTVTGTVTDSSTGEPVPFAAIQLKGTMVGGMTDADGLYSISVPADGVLIFSSVGYKDTEVEVASKAVHDVLLAPDTEMIEETIDSYCKIYLADEITPDIWRVNDPAGNIPNQIDCAKLILEKIKK